MLETRDFLDLETLCRELDASESSVRRDLDILEAGKACSAASMAARSPCRRRPAAPSTYAVESVRLSDEKDRIARLTAGLIEDGQTVILDGGSTVAAVARELASKSLHIVTNSLPIAESLESLRNIELTLTGGYLDPRLRVMLGPFCEQMLGAIRADAVIMGIGGITEAGFSNNNTLVVGSEQKMIEIASQGDHRGRPHQVRPRRHDSRGPAQRRARRRLRPRARARVRRSAPRNGVEVLLA